MTPEQRRRVTFIAGTVLACAVLASAPTILDAGDLRLAAEILVVFTIAQMWNLLAGYAGLVSLGQQAFIGIGAYSLYFLSNDFGVSAYAGIAAAAAASGLLAAAAAPLLFRLRDAYFAIGMWVFAEIVRLLVSKADWLGGNGGMPFLGIRAMDGIWFPDISYWCAAVVAAVSVALTQGLMRSPVGLALMAVRDNDLAAAAAGVNVRASRFVAFVLSASVTGAAGAVYFMSALFVDAKSAFDVNWVVIALFIVIVGGIGSDEGPVIGTIVYFGLRELFRDAEGWYLVLMGAVALATILVAPRGIWGRVSQRYALSAFSVRRVLDIRRTGPT